MKIAVLILCHKRPEQLNMFLEIMKHPAFTFFLHVDKKSSMTNEIISREDVIVLPDEKRVDVKWGEISLVTAALNLFEYAVSKDSYDFYWLCSGQDFPIKPVDVIATWFENHPNKDFVELFKSRNTGVSHENNYDKRNAIYFPDFLLGTGKLKRVIRRIYTIITGGYNHTFFWARRHAPSNLKYYFGATWICISHNSLKWMLDYHKNHPEYYRFMENCNCPDESFFHTLLMNSPYADNRLDYLHYVDWSEGKSNPKVLKVEDYHRLIESDKLMARKFDDQVDNEIILAMRDAVGRSSKK